jgi:hypothetical protein
MALVTGLRPLFFAAILCTPVAGGSIEGRVTNSVTGEAVGGVKVRFLDRQRYVHETLTDSTGSYRLTGLEYNDYSGQFTKEGFLDSRETARYRVSGDVPVRADAQIQPLGALRGRVVDEDAKPAAGVRVECGCSRDGETATDENGDFAFQDLRPGSYTLAAKPEAKIRVQDGVRLGTVAIYYPSATELAQAARIPVRIGENVSGIEIRLKSVPVHRVAGMVLDGAGKPVAHAAVKLMGRAGAARQSMVSAIMDREGRFITVNTVIGPGSEPEVARVESRDDGTFEFVAVEPGDWRLTAEIEVDDDIALGGVASALVSEKDIEEVQIRLDGPFAVEVSVDWGDAQAPKSPGYGWIPVMLTPVDGQRRLIVDPAKNIGKINGLMPGRYRVSSSLTALDAYVAAVMWGGRDVNGQVVELTSGAAPLQVILKSGTSKVRGIIENGGGEKRDGSIVFLVSREAGETSVIRTAHTGVGGSFEFDGAVPGDYYAVAFDHPDETGVQWDGLLAAIVPIASSVRVEAGSTASVDLRMSRWPW